MLCPAFSRMSNKCRFLDLIGCYHIWFRKRKKMFEAKFTGVYQCYFLLVWQRKFVRHLVAQISHAGEIHLQTVIEIRDRSGRRCIGWPLDYKSVDSIVVFVPPVGRRSHPLASSVSFVRTCWAVFNFDLTWGFRFRALATSTAGSIYHIINWV